MRKLLIHLCVVAAVVVVLAVLQSIADAEKWRVPFYLVQELSLGAIPMAWLLLQVYPGMGKAQSWSFLLTSAALVTLACIFELVAVQNRYWTFYQEIDPLSGLLLGNIPLEEFLYYPILLNIPVLFYVHAQGFMPSFAPKPPNATLNVVAKIVAGACIAGGLILLVLAFFHNQPPLDLSIPAKDVDGAIRYTAGPPKRSWTILQLLSLGVAIFAYQRLREHLHRPALMITLAAYFMYAFALELMACGRGWWVWNTEQTSGIMFWVLPLDSFIMYVTGVLLPILLFEKLRLKFA